MKLYIKEKVFSWGDHFTVKDAEGQDKYLVRGEVFSWGRKLHVYDRFEREVAFIKQELFTWLPCYHVFVNGTEVAQVRKAFTWFVPKYHVSGLNWDVNGHFLEHDYQITKNGLPIVTITKEWMTWGDTYELDIRNPADELIALAVVLTIDCVRESSSGSGVSVTIGD